MRTFYAVMSIRTYSLAYSNYNTNPPKGGKCVKEGKHEKPASTRTKNGAPLAFYYVKVTMTRITPPIIVRNRS
jgi:hypothetical protein